MSVVVHFGPKKERGGVTGGIEKCLSLAPQPRGVLESKSGALRRVGDEVVCLKLGELQLSGEKVMKNSHTSSLRNR